MNIWFHERRVPRPACICCFARDRYSTFAAPVEVVVGIVPYVVIVAGGLRG